METMQTLKRMLCHELEEYASKSELSAGDLEPIYKMLSSIKDIYKIMDMEDPGYSRDYDRGSSYDRRDRSYPRGHYSRDEGRMRMIEQMQRMMENAEGEDREAIRRCLETMKNA